ncbi:hypothetical protein QFC21_005059 [Naganishia friedmannii]|uniref:Uncharacterized protein n=1 Tax=Naganishia friedmannii TaxID=89922 RepID=A0ACC2VBP1_9TREE|nr:hypothetical protein QFC21_005059 [Naganishia friedmannii]
MSATSQVNEAGFKAGTILHTLAETWEGSSAEEKQAIVKKASHSILVPQYRQIVTSTNGVFQLNIKNKEGKEVSWVIDAKEKGQVTKGAAKKADCTITMSDDTFAQLAEGKANAQKLFMTGGLKVKGNVMLATKLDTLLKSTKAKL